MATIPMGNYGEAVARPGPMPALQRGDPLGDAAQHTAQIASNVANDMAAQDAKRADEARRAQAALTLAKTSNEMHDAHDEVARGVVDGSIAPDKAGGELQARVGKIRDTALDGWEPTQRTVMEAHLETTTGALQRSLTGAVAKRQQVDAAGTIDQFGEQVSREGMRQGPAWAAQKYGALVDFHGGAAGLDEKARAKLKQSFSEKVHADFFTQAGVAALEEGNDTSLRNLREQVNGPQGEAMDPKQRAVVSHTLFGWEQSILAKRDRAANQAEEAGRRQYNAAVDVFNKGTDLALSGGYFSPDFIHEMVTTAAGTEMAPSVERLIASQRTVAGFASLPAAERAARIERARATRATPGAGTDPVDDKLLNAMTTMDDKLRRQADENPWAAAQSAGVIKDAPVFSLADPQSAVQTIQQRMLQIGQIETWTGKRASPLQPAEVDQLSKFVRQLPLDQAASMLANIGGALDNEERVGALGKQLHDTDGTLGRAMMYASAGTTEGRAVAELVLRGEQALKDKTALVDKAAESGWRSKIAKEVRGVYGGKQQLEDEVIEAAYQIAAGQYADGKGADIDRAVRLATGGIAERNGQKFPLPYGMTEGDFDKRVSAIDVATMEEQARDGMVYVGRTPMPLADFVATLPKASLIHAGQGIYNVRAGAAVVTNAQGKRVSLKVSP